MFCVGMKRDEGPTWDRGLDYRLESNRPEEEAFAAKARLPTTRYTPRPPSATFFNGLPAALRQDADQVIIGLASLTRAVLAAATAGNQCYCNTVVGCCTRTDGTKKFV